jgi:hypothetical protein
MSRLVYLRTAHFFAASERTMRARRSVGVLRHRLVDDVVAVASSTDASATQTTATASGSHHCEQLDRFVHRTTAIHRRRKMAAGGQWPEG